MVITSATASNIQLIVETIITSHTGIAYHVDLQEARRGTAVSVYWSWSVLSVRVYSINPECTAYTAPVAEISVSVQIPNFWQPSNLKLW